MRDKEAPRNSFGASVNSGWECELGSRLAAGDRNRGAEWLALEEPTAEDATQVQATSSVFPFRGHAPSPSSLPYGARSWPVCTHLKGPPHPPTFCWPVLANGEAPPRTQSAGGEWGEGLFPNFLPKKSAWADWPSRWRSWFLLRWPFLLTSGPWVVKNKTKQTKNSVVNSFCLLCYPCGSPTPSIFVDGPFVHKYLSNYPNCFLLRLHDPVLWGQGHSKPGKHCNPSPATCSLALLISVVEGNQEDESRAWRNLLDVEGERSRWALWVVSLGLGVGVERAGGLVMDIKQHFIQPTHL